MQHTWLLVLVIVLAVSFDFTNGFHDTANAMATSIATGALKPRVAVALSGVLNLVGAFLSVSVAATIASGIVDSARVTLPIIFAGLLGAIGWNVATWYFGLPSSSSHALVGGVIGATVVAAGFSAIKGSSILSKVIVPALLSPFIAALVAGLATFLAYRISQLNKPAQAERTKSTFRYGQLASASLVSLAHGTNDAQKTMGIVTLALIADHRLGKHAGPPFWVILMCGLAISAGTYLGGWRVIRTVGHRLFHIEAPQGFAAETASAAVLLISTHAGAPLSTTQVTTGGVIGAGLGKNASEVKWGTAGRMVTAWILTIPAAAVVAAAIGLVTKNGNVVGVVVMTVLAATVLAGVWLRSRTSPVNADNVNEDARPNPEPARAGAAV
ncbi:anion permease [uncultured Jatrophihabitans sp.]|uniref:inorganic phosphate transporter n=1 Tax=uncultured Jatrophihabitans sp. TaxID=1610747 RepID=UPI0035CC4231